LFVRRVSNASGYGKSHLIVESAGNEALGRGMKVISARVARAAQRAFGLSGPVLHGRYHLRILRTPREVRRALAYVLLNARKHWRERHGSEGLNPARSSGLRADSRGALTARFPPTSAAPSSRPPPDSGRIRLRGPDIALNNFLS
jgi:hypothetical protein